MAGGSMKLTEKAQGAATIDSYVLVTQMELPSDYVITGNEEEGELDAMKKESVRRIPTSEIVELVQDNLEIDDEPTDESDALLKSGTVKSELDRIDEDISSLKENLTDLQEIAETKAAAIYETASGEIASFSDGADDMPMKSCAVNIEPIQEGEGDPSPDNVRPISGRTGLSVARTGKNLFPAINGAEYSRDTLSVVCNNGEYTLTIGIYDLSVNALIPDYAVDGLLADNKIIPAGTYTFSVAVSQWGSGTELEASKLKLILRDNVTGSTVEIKNGQTNTLTHDCTINSIGCARSYYMRVSSVTKFTAQLELSSTATDYELYKGTTYSVNWETEAGTVYGGTLDIVSGKLTVDRAIYTLDGSTRKFGSVHDRGAKKAFGIIISGTNHTNAEGKVLISNMLTWTSDWYTSMSDWTYGSALGVPSSHVFAFDDTAATIEEANALLAKWNTEGNPLTVTLLLATPIHYLLTTETIKTLLGDNNIWSDSGNVTVEYPADTKTYIDNKIAEAIAAALA